MRTKEARSEYKKGFTLIELVVAATIFAFIAASIGVSLFSGIKIWSRARNTDFVKAGLILDLETMTNQIYQCVDLIEIGFEGNAREFSFPTVSGNSVIKIIYRFDPDGKVLYRTKIDLGQILADKDKAKVYEGEKYMLLDDFSVIYSYYDKENKVYIESDSWKKEKGPFELIELRLKVRDEEFKKKIFVPISQ